MSRFRKKRNQPTVSLFPFLAVLICTLGVLIIMLVLAVKSADISAAKKQDEAAQAVTEQIETARQLLALQEYRTEAIQGIRTSVVNRVTQSRQNRSYLQDDVRKTEKKLREAVERLQSIDDSLSKTTAPSSAPVDEKRLSKIENQIDNTRSKIADAKIKLKAELAKQKETGPSRYSLLPFHGAGGTFRRPIYVECLADSIRLQPLNITIKKSDFGLPIRAGNPLDAALLSIQEYWQQHDVAGEQGSPYPLLVVRPDGAETFVLARRAMKSWTDEFGYELVDGKKELNFGQRDPALAGRIQNLVASIKQERYQLAIQRQALERHLGQFSSGQPRGGLIASGRQGGFVTTPSGPPSVARTSFQSTSEQNSGSGQNGNNNPQRSPGANRTGQSSGTNRSQNSNTAQASTQPGNGSSSTASQGQSSVGSTAPPDSLAAKRGTGWALPSNTAGGTGYLRPITVVCEPHNLRIRTASGQWRSIPFASSSNTSNSIAPAVDQMVEVIWQRIDSWGIAGQGSFWKPQLRVVTQAGAENRYAQLQGLLKNSGLVVERSSP
jgi:hypothetical protein